MAADADAGQLLEPYRKYLWVLAQVHLDARLRGKLDPADVVQQVLLRACVGLDQLRDRAAPVVAAWLRKILAHTLADRASFATWALTVASLVAVITS